MNIVQKEGILMPKIITDVKNTLLEQSKQLVIESGLKSLTMRALSERTEIAVGTIYNYFPTKKHLVLQLMEQYWYDFLSEIDLIEKKSYNVFDALKSTYLRLEALTNRFIEVFLKDFTDGYDSDSKARSNLFTEKLIKKVENLLIKGVERQEISLYTDSFEGAKFIMLNMLMIAQTKAMTYESFEITLKKLLEK